jgi:hypothetical protein
MTVDLVGMVAVALVGFPALLFPCRVLQTEVVAVAVVHRKAQLFPGQRVVPVSSLFAILTVLI